MKTIIDKNTGQVLFATVQDFEDNETQIAVSKLVTEKFVKPFFNFETQTFYEGATQEEIDFVEVPQIVTNAQFRLALIESGQSISAINTFINSKDEPIRDVLNSLWEYANHFERQNPQLIAMSELLGLSSEQLSALFILANTK